MEHTRRNLAIVLAAFASLAAATDGLAQLPSFPGAEGFGALATGGRGGSVYIVTNLNNSGSGSLRDAVSQPNRTVVFEVGGTINITSQLVFANNVSVFGQTAPGGIAVYGHGVSMSNRNNIVVQHMTFRSGMNTSDGTKALNITGGSNIMLDHLSVSWGRWDNIGFTDNAEDITLQNSIASEAIDPQRLGALIDSSRDITVARNLWVNNQSRNPKGKADMQYINNVVYNWGSNGYVGGHSSAPWEQDLINNYLIAGPNSSLANAFTQFTSTDRIYHSGNLLDADRDGVLDGRLVVDADFKGESSGDAPTFVGAAQNYPAIPVTIWSAEEAFESVLAKAGNFRFRDSADQRIVSHVQSLGTHGTIIGNETQVGGPPQIVGGTPPLDTSRDGVPDYFQLQHGFGISEVIHNVNSGDGYTWLEKYVHSLTDSETTTPPDTVPWTIATAFGRGADAEVTENTSNGITTAGGNGASAAMNSRWVGAAGDRNEYILLRFDLSELDDDSIYSARLDLTAFRNMQNNTLRVYGLDATTEDQLWNETTANFATAPALTFDGNSGTRGLDLDLVDVLGDFTEGAAAEGQTISFSNAALAAFLNQMVESNDDVATLLIERISENTGQTRFATKEATNLFSTPAGTVPSGTYAPVLHLELFETPGDFNRDGFVDAADYVAWRKVGGGQAEFNRWTANFGQAVEADLSANSNVPEPPTFVILALVFLAMTSGDARKRRQIA
jgi:hypothetical protein